MDDTKDTKDTTVNVRLNLPKKVHNVLKMAAFSRGISLREVCIEALGNACVNESARVQRVLGDFNVEETQKTPNTQKTPVAIVEPQKTQKTQKTPKTPARVLNTSDTLITHEHLKVEQAPEAPEQVEKQPEPVTAVATPSRVAPEVPQKAPEPVTATEEPSRVWVPAQKAPDSMDAFIARIPPKEPPKPSLPVLEPLDEDPVEDDDEYPELNG